MDFTEFDNLILSINNIKEGLAEQYDNENISLNQTIIELTQLLKERNSRIEELEKQVADNKFNEDNYNKVSILRILSKENDDLKKQNQQLMTSLNYRTDESDVNIEESNVEEVTNVEEEANVNEELNILEKINYKNKEYYIVDDIVYKIKKNGDKGKNMGKLIDGKIKLKNKKK